MITISLKSSDKKYTFSKERIVIGSDENADIPLNKSSLEREHLIILLEHSRYKVVNKANDPFTSLNKLPFGKRSIKTGDHLVLQDIEIEVIETQTSDYQPLKDLKESEEIKEFSSPKIPEIAATPEIKKTEIKFPILQKVSRKEKEASRPAFSLFMIVMTILVATGLYFFSILPQYLAHPNEEKEAAYAVSDVAMALLYAQVNHLTPDKLNWSSPKTIKELMRHLLPSQESAFHTEGQDVLTTGQYTIHVYHNVKGDRFVILARPTWLSSLTWWKSHPSILLDSKEMQLRRIEDSTPYQRLFALHPNLTKENEDWFNSIIKNEKIIPLSFLNEKNQDLNEKNQDLSEQETSFIYNLPRYSFFTDALLRKIVHQRGHVGAGESRYEKRLQEYLQLKDLILYTTLDLRQVIGSLENIELDTVEPVHVMQISSQGTPMADAVIVPLHGSL